MRASSRLSPENAALPVFFQIENKMDIIVEYELDGEIPLIE